MQVPGNSEPKSVVAYLLSKSLKQRLDIPRRAYRLRNVFHPVGLRANKYHAILLANLLQDGLEVLQLSMIDVVQQLNVNAEEPPLVG